MRCAHCKEAGPAITVDHVKSCSGISFDKFTDDGIKPVTAEPQWPASDKQISYVLGLQRERVLPDNWLVYDEPTLRLLERDEVSGIIQSLKGLSRKEVAPANEWTMPKGRYALKYDNGWRFFEISKPTDGRWKGYTFIKRLIGAPGQYRKEVMSPGDRVTAMKRIEADPKEAMVNYGLHSGVCGMCSSPLSDPDSLRRGIGPICASKSGWSL